METQFRTWRRKNRLALEDIADLTGFSISMLSRVERGKRNLSPKAKVTLAKRLGVHIRDLFPVEECNLS
jgi:transcriptional regulator with XRE-family HTH domain